MISSAAAIGGYWTKNPSVTRAAWGTEPARSTVRFQYAFVTTQTRRPAMSSRQAVRAAGRCQRTPAAIATRKPTWTALLNATAAGSGRAGEISARPVPARSVASQYGRALAGVPRPLATSLLLFARLVHILRPGYVPQVHETGWTRLFAVHPVLW